MEIAVDSATAHNTNRLELFQFFETNGYKISLKDFFSKEYMSPLEITSKLNFLNNFFIVYENFLDEQ